ncbi:MAG TPA: ribbon-helix-helix protein, CopG family [Thermoanaerobaculia bacterium]|nr:ribbon-helix-helix protein, CopG family [Thermoanaerobaculia bacterium]
MRTVQMTLDEALVEEVDRVAGQLGTTRSAFARDALRAALAAIREEEMEHRHRAGYERQPVQPDEVADWQSEQVWGD